MPTWITDLSKKYPVELKDVVNTNPRQNPGDFAQSKPGVLATDTGKRYQTVRNEARDCMSQEYLFNGDQTCMKKFTWGPLMVQQPAIDLLKALAIKMLNLRFVNGKRFTVAIALDKLCGVHSSVKNDRNKKRNRERNERRAKSKAKLIIPKTFHR